MSISQRTKDIVNWHLEGHSRAFILEALAAQGVARPGAVIDLALREVAAVAGTADQDTEWYKAALRMLYGANVEEKNFKDAHHVLKDMMAVDGVIEDTKRRKNLEAAGQLTVDSGQLTAGRKAQGVKAKAKSTKKGKQLTGDSGQLTAKKKASRGKAPAKAKARAKAVKGTGS